MTIPQMQRILTALELGHPLQGKDRDRVIAWAKPRARRVMQQTERKARIKANPIEAAAAGIHSDKKALLRAADDAFSILVRTMGTATSFDGRRYGHCCTCNKPPLRFNQLQAGHWIKRGQWGTRFTLENVHPQCENCNMPAKGNGRVKEHESHIAVMHGHHMLDKLRVKAKFNQRRPSNKELADMAVDFMQRAVNLGYRESDSRMAA